MVGLVCLVGAAGCWIPFQMMMKRDVGQQYNCPSEKIEIKRHGDGGEVYLDVCGRSLVCYSGTGDWKCFNDETECCRVCRSGQPCGDSCISWSKTCRKPSGCAC